MNSPSSRLRSNHYDVDEAYHRNRFVHRRMDDPYVGPPLEDEKVGAVTNVDQNDYYRQTFQRKITPANDSIGEPYTYNGQRTARPNCDMRALGYYSDKTGHDTSNRFDPSSLCTYGTNLMKGNTHMQSLRRCHHLTNEKAISHVDRSTVEERQRSYVRSDTATRRGEPFIHEFHENDTRNYRSTRVDAPFGASHLPRGRNAENIRPKSPSEERSSGNTVEVSPGEFLRLRSTKETWDAVLNDFYMPCMCVSCEITLFCIQDACCVVCPACREIRPMDAPGLDGGVGLGLTIETLAEWQAEIQRLQQRDHIM
jgi:hypothetical protein